MCDKSFQNWGLVAEFQKLVNYQVDRTKVSYSFILIVFHYSFILSSPAFVFVPSSAMFHLAFIYI